MRPTNKLTIEDIQKRLPDCMECLSEADRGDGKVKVRCRKYNVTFDRSLITIRHTHDVNCDKCRSVGKAFKNNPSKEVTERKRRTFRLKQINKARSLVCKVLTRKKSEQNRKEREDTRMLAGVRNDNKLNQIALKVCPQCKKVFITSMSHQIYCSHTCGRIVHDLKRTDIDVIDKDITLQRLYKRDAGICQLCGKPCDWNDYQLVNGVKICGDFYPSKDHIIPVSKGGAEAWNNVQLAHRICNSRKGNRVVNVFV